MKFKGRLYATDSKSGVIVRGQDEISCREPKFDQFICLPISDYTQALKDLQDLSWRCEKWK